jgi:hypothetical protein
MISLLDVAERVRTGPRMEPLEYDMGLFRKTQELTKRYGLRNPGKEEFWDVDNAYADAIFHAGVDFLAEWGAYDVTTNRVIKFTEDETRLAAREAPTQIAVGTGRDARIIRRRGIEDPRPPAIIVAGHSGWSDEVPVPLPIVVREMVRDPRVDAIQGFMYAKTDGLEIMGEPLWAYGARRAVERVRNGFNMAGRPGLCLIQYPTQTRAFILISALDPEKGLRKSDGTLLSIQPDLHIETGMIAASLVFEEYGLAYKENQGGGTSFAGDVYGSMIISVASRLTAWMAYRDVVQGPGSAALPSGPHRMGTMEGRPTGAGAVQNLEWLSFATRKALLRNASFISKGNIWGGHERTEDQMSEEFLLRVALSAMKTTLLGDNFHFAGSANPPTFPRWAIDVSDATLASGLRFRDYMDIERRVRERLPHIDEAVTYDFRMKVYERPRELLEPQMRAYDFFKQRISQEYLENERRVRKYLTDLGLNFQNP